MTAASPALEARRLMMTAGMVVRDVRCAARQPELGAEEHVGSLEVVMPMAGVFVREGRRAGAPDRPVTTIADPTRALLFRPGERHRVRHPLGGADRSLAITLEAEAHGQLTGSAAGLPASLPVPARVHLFARRLAAALAAERLDPLSGADLTISLLDAVCASADPAARRLNRPIGPGRRAVDAAVDEVCVALTDRMGEPLSLAGLGRLVGYSPFHLARAFRSVTGLSIHAYRTQLRVRAVLARIEAGDRDLTGVALDHGFADQSHMTNVVGRLIGRPPSALRRPPSGRELRDMRTILQA